MLPGGSGRLLKNDELKYVPRLLSWWTFSTEQYSYDPISDVLGSTPDYLLRSNHTNSSSNVKLSPKRLEKRGKKWPSYSSEEHGHRTLPSVVLSKVQCIYDKIHELQGKTEFISEFRKRVQY